jgi:hypothetical protein
MIFIIKFYFGLVPPVIKLDKAPNIIRPAQQIKGVARTIKGKQRISKTTNVITTSVTITGNKIISSNGNINITTIITTNFFKKKKY